MPLETPIQLLSSTAPEISADKVTCRLCRRQFAKYTCPTCNVPYCSLTCFRSQAHNQCSEGFYKKEIEADIQTGPSKTAQERHKMMELLKNFEEGSSNQQSFSEGDEEDEDYDDPSDLAKRFEAVDLDSASPDALWAVLTPEERAKFMKAFDDPTSELAQQLLSSEQLEKEIPEPWWEAPSISESEDEEPRNHRTPRRYGSRPMIMSIPISMVKAVPSGHPLVYNMCAICIAYAYITRHLGTSPLCSLKPDDTETHEARRLVTQMVPFLTDHKSTKLYPNLPAVITDIWSTFDLGKMTSELFSLLLLDAARLLKPLRVTHVMPASVETPTSEELVLPSHPHIMPVLVLSDLNELFSPASRLGSSQDSQVRSKGNHVTHKLLFYTVHILSTPSVILQTLADEMTTRAEGYRQKENASERTHVEREHERTRRLVEEI